MIGYLEGTVQARLSHGVVVLTAGGVGYQVRLPTPVLARLMETGGEVVRLFVSTVVRPDDIALYGFDGPDGKALFEMLTSVSGIGPKLALALLSAMSPGEAVEAIVVQDVARLSSVPGIGKKTAARVCLELSEKLRQRPLEAGELPAGAVAAASGPGGQDELVSALTNLGFPEKDVLAVLRRLPPSAQREGATPFGERLKQALAWLGRS
jgi:Holliday junction DNA helicase RuvA